jgi:hypothetical protein
MQIFLNYFPVDILWITLRLLAKKKPGVFGRGHVLLRAHLAVREGEQLLVDVLAEREG